MDSAVSSTWKLATPVDISASSEGGQGEEKEMSNKETLSLNSTPDRGFWECPQPQQPVKALLIISSMDTTRCYPSALSFHFIAIL
jgi:hypothetical protein